MAVSPGFREFVLEQLEQVARDVRSRGMFGGVGIYAGDHFFALIASDVLYFKVDDATRPHFIGQGMRPFQPYGPDKETMGYYEVPIAVLEDVDLLKVWVAQAILVAQRARASADSSARPHAGPRPRRQRQADNDRGPARRRRP